MPLFVVNVLAAIFEVMDKEPSLLDIWLFALVVGVGGFFLCRRRPRLLALVLPVALLFSVGSLTELHDPVVGPYILREAGRTYFIHSYAAMAVEVILPCSGVLARRKRPT